MLYEGLQIYLQSKMSFRKRYMVWFVCDGQQRMAFKSGYTPYCIVGMITAADDR